jgi:hypothetical protein
MKVETDYLDALGTVGDRQFHEFYIELEVEELSEQSVDVGSM